MLWQLSRDWRCEHGKDLYQYWKEDLTVHFLNELSETKGDQVLLNLASKEYSKAFNGTLKDEDVMKLVGITRVTYYKYKKEIKEELQAQGMEV